ncbi:2-C-methyl-D-erythritol 2,4-cyclodiphosphate synthase [Gottschalkiaceae bacterium SANA]|nr:2-C-methyl-D-erythritol 2,4-cyclodiphosphate synthase [Gottschalkiaceae bacterium SANA]
MRIGIGIDAHRLVPERPLILGGVTIPYELGLLGHSDADVLTHAIMDALLGAVALGDIGQHFPPSDQAYRGANSLDLLEVVMTLLTKQGYRVENIDAVIVAQAPKLAPYLPMMRKKIAQAMAIELHQLSIKATTTEKMGYEGRGEGISAQAVALVEAIND